MSNKLQNEKSPYLLQHKDNPVYWYPWCGEAFCKAKEEEKPIFLSIGYSTCHWCHVMAEESFEDKEIAKLLNQNFISIKVDREERPDIDAVYMSVCQMLTGSGGWPLTIIMTPDQKPFFAGTYFPKRQRYGRAGLWEILHEVVKLWKVDKERLLCAGEEIIHRYLSKSRHMEKGSRKGTFCIRHVVCTGTSLIRNGAALDRLPSFRRRIILCFCCGMAYRRNQCSYQNMLMQTGKEQFPPAGRNTVLMNGRTERMPGRWRCLLWTE